MQEQIQQFQTDDGHIHRIVITADKDRLPTITLETAHTIKPDYWIPRQRWFVSKGCISSGAGGYVIVHSDGAEYIYRPMTTEVEVKDHLIDPEPESVLPNNETLFQDLLEFKESFSDAFKQREFEMVNSLLCHFPIEDGMSDFDDVTEWLSGFLNKDRDSVRVQYWAEKVLQHMSQIYPTNY